MLRIIAGVLERLDEKSLLRIGHVGCKLTHLVSHTTIRILVCHSQHLVGLQLIFQGDITHRLVDRILRGIQQASTLQLLEVTATHKSGTLQGRGSLVDITGSSVLVDHGIIFRICLVAWNLRATCAPHRIAHLLGLTQVGQGDEISSVFRRTRLVGNPHLHAVDGDTRGQVGQFLHPPIIAITKIPREKEVLVLLIVGNIGFKRGQLNTALGRNTLRG